MLLLTTRPRAQVSRYPPHHMNTPVLPPSLAKHLAAAATGSQFTAIGAITLYPLTAGATSTIDSMQLPLPDGFTLAEGCEVMIQAAPGFLFPPGGASELNFLALDPFQSDSWGTPAIAGPYPISVGPFPEGALFAWNVKTGTNTYSNTTMSFGFQSFINPTVTGLTGNFYVTLGGTNGTSCQFTIPGFVITPASSTGPGA